MQIARRALAATSLVGARVSLPRPPQRRVRRRARSLTGGRHQPTGLRIGEVAGRDGTTPGTVRYDEEIGILPASHEREPGAHGVTMRWTSAGGSEPAAPQAPLGARWTSS